MTWMRIVNPKAKKYYSQVLGSDVIPVTKKGGRILLDFDSLDDDKKEKWIQYTMKYYSVSRKQAMKWLRTIYVPEYAVEPWEGFFCPFCGTALDEREKYCPECGRDISDLEEEKETLPFRGLSEERLKEYWRQCISFLELMHKYGLESISFDEKGEARVSFRVSKDRLGRTR